MRDSSSLAGLGWRKRVSVLHTWAGVSLGLLLFAIFWMGTLSVFDREIDRWMMPATRVAPVAIDAQYLDRVVVAHTTALGAETSFWQLQFPTDRAPFYSLTVRGRDGRSHVELLHPVSGDVLPPAGSLGGTGFIFPFHANLLVEYRQLGTWVVGAAGMAMLVLLVSGVIIHRRLLADFFLFRPKKQSLRATLDLHNLSSMVALPFHFFITLSGLVILFATYFPGIINTAFPDDRAVFEQQALGDYRRAPAGVPAHAASLSTLMLQAQQRWAEQGAPGVPRALRVWHPGDAGSFVEVRRAYLDRVAMTQQTLYFDAVTGATLFEEHAKPVRTAQRFISGLHFLQFDHWLLRWLFFLGGLSSCVMIATGMLFWAQARSARHAAHGVSGAKWVHGLSIGGVTGIVIATLAFFISNRLLPQDGSIAPDTRAAYEVLAFFFAWLIAMLHAARQSWAQQCWVIAVLAVMAVILNALTTHEYLWDVLNHGRWQVVGMDITLLVGSVVAAVIARRLNQREAHS